MLAALAALAALSAASASAATPAQQIAKLQKQVAQLQKDVRFLRNELNANYDGDACIVSATADAFQQTWMFSSSAVPFPATSTTPRVTEKDYNCANIRVSRTVPTPGQAPNVAVFQQILNWIG